MTDQASTCFTLIIDLWNAPFRKTLVKTFKTLGQLEKFHMGRLICELDLNVHFEGVILIIQE